MPGLLLEFFLECDPALDRQTGEENQDRRAKGAVEREDGDESKKGIARQRFV